MHQSLRSRDKRAHVIVRQLGRRQDSKALPVKHRAAMAFEIRRNMKRRQALSVGLGSGVRSPIIHSIERDFSVPFPK